MTRGEDVFYCSPARAISALGLCALLVLHSVPVSALSVPGLTPRHSYATLRSAAQSVQLLASAKLGGAGILLSLSPMQDGSTIPPSDAVRFLEQATFGPSFATDPADPNYPVSVAHVQELGFQGWLNEQFAIPVLYPDDPMVPNIGTNYQNPGDPGTCGTGGMCWSPVNRDPATCDNTCSRDNYTAYLLQVQFYRNALTGPDQLRQRVAWALSQIDVVSQVDIGRSSWMVPYLQVFDHDAFGNYRQLLYDITVNPAMGEYLNMRGNVKTNVNENYAREILQLFSVGLNKLNIDGTPQFDDQGNLIPTYGQDEITNFARVFTGWNLDRQLAPGILNYRDPMIVPNENNHDRNPKTLLDGATLDAGLDAVTELNAALDNIFNHPNVGPFISRELIQHLVTSNPSPDYVARVASVFNDDCSGLFPDPNCMDRRGNLQAVITAILLDPEARNAPTDTNYGHLREPVLFITNTLRALGVGGTDFVLGDSFLPSNVRMGQDVFRSPTVFNYYPPDNQMPCPTAPSCPLGPEFAIQSTSTSLARINFIYEIAYQKMLTDVNRPKGTWIDTSLFEPESVGDATQLVDDLNLRLLGGAMTDALRGIVLNAVTAIPETDATGRVREAIYLIATSAQYQVER